MWKKIRKSAEHCGVVESHVALSAWLVFWINKDKFNKFRSLLLVATDHLRTQRWQLPGLAPLGARTVAADPVTKVQTMNNVNAFSSVFCLYFRFVSHTCSVKPAASWDHAWSLNHSWKKSQIMQSILCWCSHCSKQPKLVHSKFHFPKSCRKHWRKCQKEETCRKRFFL